MKTICLIFLLSVSAWCFGQKPNWQNLDLQKDSTMGIGTERAYLELLKNKRASTVLVAVIDGGIDTLHEDLKPVLWQNPKEKLNGKDDDKNGYIDDFHGWDFIGSSKGNVHYDNLELVRQIRQNQVQFAGKDSTTIQPSEKPAFRLFLKEKEELNQLLALSKNRVNSAKGLKKIVENMVQSIGKPDPTLKDFQDYDTKDLTEDRVRAFIVLQLQHGENLKSLVEKQLDEAIIQGEIELNYKLNINYDPRDLVDDDYFNSRQHDYGNNDVMGPEATHGTHVAGIIGAIRDNQIGIKGVADHVKVMVLRAVPNGDERDKDVANALRYAADNGAKVINMSFGKSYSQDKKAVDDAVKYALSKDVLLVQAAGNDNKNMDVEPNFPNRKYENGEIAGAWIVVGASDWKDDETLKASFSNYGSTTVDVFAPGVKIKSTIPGNRYVEFSGTSMAAPVVTGLAALIREYYPKLTAVQVKEIIMKSVVKIGHNVSYIENGRSKSIPFASLCLSGGIVNAYGALQLAATYK
ncbi:subtilase family protein [Mucilaginibacter gracilis]|uniref:Subtilase family protein n=1 Tax=Mucilaginibacter gracilis TaxID=423350 RepID=A0A495J2S2_9SPHI|nr:S8 family peptidase [Mucilaginibacter gracilis]RKR82932.1 subtilase family protein [Mucilaginibacter gracilis]